MTMLLASQSFPDHTTPFGKVVGNCGRVRGYHPKADDLHRSADYFRSNIMDVDTLLQGECYDKGPFFSRYHDKNVVTTLKGRTTSFTSDNDEDDENST